MGKRKHLSGLIKRGDIWHIDKQINGRRICKSTGATERRIAEAQLKQIMADVVRSGSMFGAPTITFEQAALQWATDHMSRKSIERDIQDLESVLQFIADQPLRSVHQLTLEPYVQSRKEQGIASSTVKRTLSTVRRVLEAAHSVYRDGQGQPWLASVPKLSVETWSKPKARIVLSQQEESCLLGALSCDLSDIALFLLHTGLREGELRSLRWDMEEESHDGVLVFRLPAEVTKNNQDRLVLCNCVAARVIRRRREFDSDWVFANADGSRRRARLSSSGWRRGRERACRTMTEQSVGNYSGRLSKLRVHDLRHTFGDRLRRRGVTIDTCGDLLGHKGRGVTAHYCRSQNPELISAVKKLECFEVPQNSRTEPEGF